MHNTTYFYLKSADGGYLESSAEYEGNVTLLPWERKAAGRNNYYSGGRREIIFLMKRDLLSVFLEGMRPYQVQV